MVIPKQIERLGDKAVIVMSESELAALNASIGTTVGVGKAPNRLTPEEKRRLMENLMVRYDSAFRELAK